MDTEKTPKKDVKRVSSVCPYCKELTDKPMNHLKGTRTGCYRAVLADGKDPDYVKNMMRDKAYEFTKRQVISEAVLLSVATEVGSADSDTAMRHICQKLGIFIRKDDTENEDRPPLHGFSTETDGGEEGGVNGDDAPNPIDGAGRDSDMTGLHCHSTETDGGDEGDVNTEDAPKPTDGAGRGSNMTGLHCQPMQYKNDINMDDDTTLIDDRTGVAEGLDMTGLYYDPAKLRTDSHRLSVSKRRLVFEPVLESKVSFSCFMFFCVCFFCVFFHIFRVLLFLHYSFSQYHHI